MRAAEWLHHYCGCSHEYEGLSISNYEELLVLSRNLAKIARLHWYYIYFVLSML